MRKHVGGWLAKIFIGLLVMSFAVWGVADIFTGYGLRSLATIGDTEISAEEFRFAFQREMRAASARLSRPISLDQARAIGLDGQVLGRMIGEATLDNDAREQRLGISTDEVARSIADDPAFRDSFGNFNRFYFEQILRSNGLNEAGYVARQRRVLLRQQIARTIAASPGAPDVLIKAVHRFTQERRAIAYTVLTAANIDPIPAPEETVLREFFEANKGSFRAPEMRRIEIVTVSPVALADKVDVSARDIAASYEVRIANFDDSERREVQQILFPSIPEARAAAAKIAAGTDFLDMAKERGLSESDISLGLVEESAIIDPAVRKAAFSLAAGEVSEPVAARLGAVLVRAVKIEPRRERSLGEVSDEIRKELAQKQAREKVLDLYDSVEDQRATGAPFSEIASKLDLPRRVIEAIDAQGRDASGSPISDLPARQDIIEVSFDTDPGVELDPIQTVEGGFVWLEVLDITPERERSLDEVRGKVEQAWRAEELAKRLAARAGELLKRLKEGASLDTVASELKTVVTTTRPLRRSGSDDVLSQAAIQTAFATAKQGFATSLHLNGTDRVLIEVRRIEVPEFAPSSEDGKRTLEGVTASLSSGLLSEYIAAKQNRFGVTINQQSLQALLGQN